MFDICCYMCCICLLHVCIDGRVYVLYVLYTVIVYMCLYTCVIFVLHVYIFVYVRYMLVT